jgi:hypothetical protein
MLNATGPWKHADEKRKSVTASGSALGWMMIASRRSIRWTISGNCDRSGFSFSIFAWTAAAPPSLFSGRVVAVLG